MKYLLLLLLLIPSQSYSNIIGSEALVVCSPKNELYASFTIQDGTHFLVKLVLKGKDNKTVTFPCKYKKVKKEIES